MNIALFTFNPFRENTYILYDTTGECIIIDPGCHTESEQNQLTSFIEAKDLRPVRLINTHCHIDHVLGNRFVSERYDLPVGAHRGEKVVLDLQPQVSEMYAIPYRTSPDISVFYEDGDTVSFGETTLTVFYTPGHSPASISLYSDKGGFVIVGDVLFDGSIGRTDLPGGDFDTLARSIKTKLYNLPDDTKVLCGHGPSTTLGKEKKSNPFVRGE